MAISCTPADLVNASKAFRPIAEDAVQTEAVKCYLLAVIAGGSTDPADLQEAAKCFACFETRTLLEIQASLLCQILTNDR